MTERQLNVVIPTFERPAGLQAVLASLQPFATDIGRVYVVDNAASSATAALLQEVTLGGPQVVLERPPDNIGPAGATALVMRLLMEQGATGWLLRLDDDRPVAPNEFLALWNLARELDRGPHDIGGLALRGATWSARRARLRAPKPGQAATSEVDYVKTNALAFFHMRAIQATGGFRGDLFFGMSEVEFGLRIREAGFRLLQVNVPDRRDDDTRWPTSRAGAIAIVDWRRYYSMRNLIVILRATGHPWVAARVALVRGGGKAVLGIIVRRPEAGLYAKLMWWAVRDAYLQRMGRQIDPATFSSRQDHRGPQSDRSHT